MRPRTKNPLRCPHCGANVKKVTNSCTGNSYYKCQNSKCAYILGYTGNIKPYIFINNVDLGYETFLIAENVKNLGNKSLFRYLNNSENFYTDSILNYLIQCSGLLNIELTDYIKNTVEIRLHGEELLKLFPHKSFTLEISKNFKLLNISRPNALRMSKNDVIAFQFSKEYIDKARLILLGKNLKDSIIRVPMSFVIQTTKSNNMGPNCFSMLLWTIALYKVPSPLLLHSTKNILTEIGACTSNGWKPCLNRLNKFFNYLFSIGALANVETPIQFTKEILRTPIKINGKFLRFQKPSSYRRLYETCGAEACEEHILKSMIIKSSKEEIRNQLNHLKENLSSFIKPVGKFDDSELIQF